MRARDTGRKSEIGRGVRVPYKIVRVREDIVSNVRTGLRQRWRSKEKI